MGGGGGEWQGEAMVNTIGNRTTRGRHHVCMCVGIYVFMRVLSLHVYLCVCECAVYQNGSTIESLSLSTSFDTKISCIFVYPPTHIAIHNPTSSSDQ